MSEFRASSRTVVTEISSFSVDTVSKTSVFRQTVSAKVPEDGALNSRDFNVSKTLDFDLEDSSSVLGIMSPEPVLLELTQSALPYVPEELNVLEPIMSIENYTIVGNDLNFFIKNLNVPAYVYELPATVFNKTTGETEDVVAHRINETEFKGTVPTFTGTSKGTDFDGVMGVKHNDLISIMYALDDTTLTCHTTMRSIYYELSITSNDLLFVGNPIGIKLEFDQFKDETSVDVRVTNEITGGYVVTTLTKSESGDSFIGVVLTSGTLSSSLLVKAGDNLIIEYKTDDALYVESSSFHIDVVENRNITGILTGDETITPGNTLELTLSDYNKAGSPSISIPVTNSNTRDYAMVTFVEDIEWTGIFKGYIDLGIADINISNLNVNIGDEIHATYIDSDSDVESMHKIVHTCTVKEAEAEEEEVVTPQPVSDTFGSVSFIVDGLFYLNGTFLGKIRVRGLEDSKTRCVLIHT